MTKDKLLTKLKIARRNLGGIPLLTEIEAEKLTEADDAIDRAMAVLKDLIDEIKRETER